MSAPIHIRFTRVKHAPAVASNNNGGEVRSLNLAFFLCWSIHIVQRALSRSLSRPYLMAFKPDCRGVNLGECHNKCLPTTTIMDHIFEVRSSGQISRDRRVCKSFSIASVIFWTSFLWLDPLCFELNTRYQLVLTLI